MSFYLKISSDLYTLFPSSKRLRYNFPVVHLCTLNSENRKKTSEWCSKVNRSTMCRSSFYLSAVFYSLIFVLLLMIIARFPDLFGCRFFKGKAPYAITKVGMTVLVHGMASELKDTGNIYIHTIFTSVCV